MKNYKILIVDDDPDIIKAVQVILQNKEYEVISASNKADALKKAAEETPDLFVLDVMMETFSDGFDLSRELRAMDKFKKTPIILLTGIDDKTGVNFKSGFSNSELLPIDAYLGKPVTPQVLLDKIKDLLPK